MRVLLALPFLMIVAAPALAAPEDASCAATFSALSASARAHGVPSNDFDRMAGIAGRRAGVVQAGDIREVSLTDLSGRVVNCHARYDRMRAEMASN